MSGVVDLDDGGDVGPKAQDSVKKEPREVKMVADEKKPVIDISPKKKEPDTQSWLSVYDSLKVNTDESFGPQSSSSRTDQSSRISALEPDGSLRFYWLDCLEHEGRLHFIGKLKDKASGSWVSCCVTVEGLQRNLFVLPREKRVEPDDDGNLLETDVVPELTDVYQDFDTVRKKMGIKKWKAKFVKRKYAFGEKDVPKEERQWMKVVYSFEGTLPLNIVVLNDNEYFPEPQIPATAHSPNFSRIFGSNTSAFEILVLKRKIMGPCWLQIKKPHVENKGVGSLFSLHNCRLNFFFVQISWCKLEATVSDPKDINPFLDSDTDAPKDIPPLTVMSLSVRTIVNHKENKREVVCTTARIWSNSE
jgi:DNA polymerase alpha subunit A